MSSLPVKAPAAKKKHSCAAHLSALLPGWRAAIRHWNEERMEVPASPHEGAGSKGAAPFLGYEKKLSQRGSYDASYLGSRRSKFPGRVRRRLNYASEP